VVRYDVIGKKDSQFYVFEAENNPDNGMQAMAVAPIKGGEVGKNYIVIVYVKSSYLLAF